MTDYKLKQNVNVTYYSLIYFFVFVLILSMLTYISYVIYNKPRKSVSISQVSFNQFENNSRQPDLTLRTNNSNTDSRKYNWQEIYEYASLDSCPKNQCVVEKENGFKRCPSDKETQLLYNPVFEYCSNKDSCDNPNYPYALKSNGEALDNICDQGVACRCLANPQCSYNTTTTFDMVNGSAYGSINSQLNYYFSINTKDDNNFERKSIIINKEDSGTRFCKLNPAFTERIPNGCDFLNSLQDPMDCKDTNIFQLIPDDNQIIYFARPEVGNIVPVGTITSYVQGSLKIAVYSTLEYMPEKGYLTFSTGGKDYNIYYDNIASSLNAMDKNKTIINVFVLDGIRGAETSAGADWNTGLPVAFSPSLVEDFSTLTINSPDKLTYEKVIYNNCSNNSLGSNYKNMLMCVQNDNQPCTNGVFGYNIDKILNTNSVYNQDNGRNFCHAYNKTRLDITKTDKFFLNDPSSFTMSCLIGSPCNGIFDNSLCLKNNCNDAIKQRKNKFYDNYDDSAVSTYWLITRNVPNNYPKANIVQNGMIDFGNSENMFNLEAGDIWSINSNTLKKFLFQDVNNSDKLILNSISDIEANMVLVYPGATSNRTIVSVDKINNIITIDANVTISKGTQITITYPYGDNSFGFIGVDNNNKTRLLTIEGNTIDFATIVNDYNNYGIILYKQFGFNGFSYNTEYNFTDQARYYSDSYTFYPYFETNDKIKPLFDYNSIFYQAGATQIERSKQVLKDPISSLKVTNSMYYPVWNNANSLQECVRCKPNFIAYTTLNNQNQINSCQIQFSGKDFSNYIHYNPTNKFVYTTFAEVYTSNFSEQLNSNTAYIVLKDINPNIQAGDYIIDSSGLLEKELKLISGQTGEEIELATSTQNPKYVIETDDYKSFKITTPEGSIQDFTPSKTQINSIGSGNYEFTGSSVNYFCGKKYIDRTNNSLFELIPKVKIEKVEGNILYTDSGITEIFSGQVFVQIIKSTETLDLTVLQNPDSDISGSGIDGNIEVEAITQHRISNVKIINPGNNYSSENKPIVNVSNYLYDNEIIKII